MTGDFVLGGTVLMVLATLAMVVTFFLIASIIDWVKARKRTKDEVKKLDELTKVSPRFEGGRDEGKPRT